MLTPQQQKALAFIRSFTLRHGISPTLQEVGDAMAIRHRGSVCKHLAALVEKGYLVKSTQGYRNFRLVEPLPDNRFCLPLAGRIAAGRPIEAIEDQDQLDLYDYLLGSDRYLLKVEGDSMIEAGILDGDLVVIRQQDHANDGEIIVALIDNHEATLKRLHHHPDGQIELRPANTTLQPMFYAPEQIQIQGVLVAQLRKYP